MWTVPESVSRRGGSLLFRDAVAQWLDLRARGWTSIGTRFFYRCATKEWNAVLGNLPIAEVRPLDVQRLYLRVDNGWRSAAWCNKQRDTLHAFFAWALGLGLIGAQSMTRASWPRKAAKHKSARSRRHVMIDDVLLEKILGVVDQKRLERILSFLLVTALRIGEALAARWDWVVPDPSAPGNWILRVPPEVRKTRDGCAVPLGRVAMEILGERREGLLFPEAPAARTIRLALREAGKKLGIEGLSPHQFRRSCATHLVNQGMPLPAVQRIVGWRSAPREWLRMLEDSYYLGIDGSEARRIQDEVLRHRFI